MTTSKQNIRISRFEGCAAHRLQIEPEDRSWVLWVDDEGKPSLWLAVDAPAEDMSEEERAQFAPGETVRENGVEVPTIHGYMPASMAYEVAPDMMADFEREAVEMCEEEPTATVQ